jgi:hypothetical protein
VYVYPKNNNNKKNHFGDCQGIVITWIWNYVLWK